MNTATGLEASREEEEDAEIEDKLIAAVVAQAQLHNVALPPALEGQAEEAQRTRLLI